jgi:FdhE protein
MMRDKWDQRIQRANELAGAYPFAAEGLRFYERVASFQKSLYTGLAAGNGTAKKARAPGTLRDELELFVLLPWFASFLSFVQDIAPAPLAQSSASLSVAGAMRWEQVLDEFWRTGAPGDAMSAMSTMMATPETITPAEELIAWAFLQPYAEHLADHSQLPEIHGAPSLCPLCSGWPQVGVLRPQGDGGKRSLICSLCATEWDFRRIVCPACGEEDVEKLPVYIAEEHGHVRVEACDTCRHYLKTIDMTKEGRAIPVVDELAAIPLSLWAAEHEYTKLSTNLLGI